MATKIWRKSSYSGGGGGGNECVEVAVTPDVVGVRDTKNRNGGELSFDRIQFANLLANLTR
jgi:hypothetical protein